MSLSTARSNVARLQKSVADLLSKEALENKKKADITSKINRAKEAASRSKNASTIQSKYKDIERHTKALAASSKKQSDIAKALHSKTVELNRYQTILERKTQEERKKQEKQVLKFHTDLENRQMNLKRPLLQKIEITSKEIDITNNDTTEQEYDVFISHASEDKEPFVKDLANALRAANIRVWYDEFSLQWGDSLLSKINQGLAQSKFGIVIFSEHFFKKEWPKKELEGLSSLEMEGSSKILPIWHNITKDEVTKHNPIFAQRLALNTLTHSIDDIVAELRKLFE